MAAPPAPVVAAPAPVAPPVLYTPTPPTPPPTPSAPVASAQPSNNKACDSETKKAKDVYDKCVKMGKSAKGYKQCAEDYKDQKQKADQACRNSVKSAEELEDVVKKWEKLSNDNRCRTNDKNKSANCAVILQQLGQELYKLEELKGGNHDASLPVFLDYIKFFPDAQSAPSMLYQASFILEVKRDLEQALKLRQTLVSKYPNHVLAPGAWLRIGEHYYDAKKWNDAIKAYEKVVNGNVASTNKKEASYAMYHMAESYYNMADFKTAAQKFMEYVNGADKGKYIKDLRDDALKDAQEAERMLKKGAAK
jgi:TolA-binding protein